MGFIPVGGIRGVVDRTRRGVLGLLAATTGCLGFGGGNEVTPGEVTDSPSSASSPTDRPSTASGTAASATDASATDASTPTATDSPSPTATDSPTATPTETPTPTATPRDAQAPPPDTLSLSSTSLSVSGVDGGTARAFVSLQNTSNQTDQPVQFTLVELRIDVFYDSPLTGQTRRVASEYFTGRFDSPTFGPGQRRTIGGRLPITDSQLDGTEPDDAFSVEFAYRRVEY